MARRQWLVASRGSPLARWQADHVIGLLGGGAHARLVVVETVGDRLAATPIHRIGGQGVFAKEVQALVLSGAADLAVHSAKDLPSAPTPGLVIAAVPRREDPRDALVGCTLEQLPVGGRVATGSVRRRAQLAGLRPDLTFADLRGNIATRLARAEGHSAVLVAMAALRRLGLEGVAAEALSPAVMVPQVGQGALAVECREDDAELCERLATVDHAPSRAAVEAERAFLAQLGSGCELPVGALAEDGRLTGMIASLDGRVVLQATEGPAPGYDQGPAALGHRLARRLLEGAGGRALLDDLQGVAS